MKLLLCMTYLNPNDSFFVFNKEKLICLAHFYLNEFSIIDLMVLSDQLDTYIINLCNDDEFSDIKGIVRLAKKIVKTKNDNLERVFQIGKYVYKIVITSIGCNCYSEESFFAMHIIKSRLRNRI